MYTPTGTEEGSARAIRLMSPFNKSFGEEIVSLESAGTMITNWFESRFFRVPGSSRLFLIEIVHLRQVGREEHIRRCAFVDLPGKAAGRAEIEFDRVLGLGLVSRADLLQNVAETRGRRDQDIIGAHAFSRSKE